MEPLKAQLRKTQAYVETSYKNNPILFTEMIKKNLELKNNDKIRKYLTRTKSLKSQTQHKNLKRIITPSTFGKSTRQGVTECKNKRSGECDIIIEGKSNTFKNLEKNSE